MKRKSPLRSGDTIRTWRKPARPIPQQREVVVSAATPEPTAATAESMPAPVASEPPRPPRTVLVPTRTTTKRIELLPSVSQRETLDSLFEGPRTLLQLLRMYDGELRTLDEAARFLDRNIRRLAPLMLRRRNGQGVKQLELLILEWAQALPEYVSFLLPDRCWLSDGQDIALPIDNLGLLPPADRDGLSRLQRENRYFTDFALISQGAAYYVDIEFEPIPPWAREVSMPAVDTPVRDRPKPPTARPRPRPPRPPRSRARDEVRTVPFVDLLQYFDNAILDRLRRDLEVSRQFSTTRFAELSGRAVSGGLPSLPKRK